MLKSTVHRVRLMRDGVLESEAYQDVEARTEKEAAEKLHGGVLFKQGSVERIRAMVRSSSGNDNLTLFYAR